MFFVFEKVYVKSDTLVGDAAHPAASVLAEIVKANIPVKNGVIHLIQNPLMVIDTPMYEFIQVSFFKLQIHYFILLKMKNKQNDERMKGC